MLPTMNAEPQASHTGKSGHDDLSKSLRSALVVLCIVLVLPLFVTDSLVLPFCR